MGKGLKILGIIVLILILVSVAGFFTLKSSKTTSAFLYIEKGSESAVFVDKGSGYETAFDEMELKETWKIKTEIGKASIVFYESDIAQLDQNTEITIKELRNEKVKTELSSGSAMHTVSKITGTRDYEVGTLNAVATVRGTRFGFFTDKLMVRSGIVGLRTSDSQKDAIQLTRHEKSLLTSFESLNMTEEDIEWFKLHEDELVEIYRRLRTREINEKPMMLSIAKKLFHADDKAINDWLLEADDGLHNLDEAEAKLPFSSSYVQKIRKITETIIKIKSGM